MSLLIDVEGIDGSGKGTQAALLCERLRSAGRAAALVSFPRYESTLFGALVGEFLNGRFGGLDDVHPLFASLLFAGDRFESLEWLRSLIAHHEVIVLDRYVASNVAHQGAKLDGAQRDELVQRIERIEFELYQMPRPDLVLLLDLPAAEAQRLIAGKRARTYTDRKADLQEADVAYLERVRTVYRQLANNNPRWRIVECMHEGTLRTIHDIANEIWQTISHATKT